MKRIIFLSTIFLTALTALAANAMAAAEPAIIPRPETETLQTGTLTLSASALVVSDAAFANEANLLAASLRAPTGFAFPVQALRTPPQNVSAPSIWLTATGAKDLGAEGYTLDVTAQGVVIRAKTAAGIFYGTQTLLQLLPSQIFANRQAGGAAWSVPFVHIEDRPALAWRGFMLDDSRHFFGKAEVEKMLDQMALMKLNVFHWHLTDDNGWRIEIKKYPKLTSIGAWRERVPSLDGPGAPRYGGFYTQAEIREVVAYAAARHITIVPEIDMPGHFSAALAAYPEFMPDNGMKPSVIPVNKYGFAMCVAKPQAVQFCKDVLDEVIALFPSKYIHIGGDEVDFNQWKKCPISNAALKTLKLKNMGKLQEHFQDEMIAYVESKGRHAITWQWDSQPSLDKRVTYQFWYDGMAKLVPTFTQGGSKVILSTQAIYYYPQHPPLERAYQTDAAEGETSAVQKANYLGIEGCLWSEHSENAQSMEKKVFPLIFVHAELGWTQPDRKDWASFAQRLPSAIQRCQLMGVSYNQNQANAALTSVPPAQP